MLHLLDKVRVFDHLVVIIDLALAYIFLKQPDLVKRGLQVACFGAQVQELIFMNHVHLDFLHYINDTIDNFVRVDIFTTHHGILQSFSGDFVRTFKLLHSLDYTIHLAALNDLLILSPKSLQSVLFDLLR